MASFPSAIPCKRRRAAAAATCPGVCRSKKDVAFGAAAAAAAAVPGRLGENAEKTAGAWLARGVPAVDAGVIGKDDGAAKAIVPVLLLGIRTSRQKEDVVGRLCPQMPTGPPGGDRAPAVAVGVGVDKCVGVGVTPLMVGPGRAPGAGGGG